MALEFSEVEEVPIPTPKRRGRKAVLSYPIAGLTPGTDESFLVDVAPESVKKVSMSIRTFAYRHGMRVIIRPAEDWGIRVWRKV